MNNINTNEFLSKQLLLLAERSDRENSEVEWQDVTDFRIGYYGESEARDTTRKGYKMIGEYIEAGWKITPRDNTIEPINSRQTTSMHSDKSQTSERQFYIEDEKNLRNYDYLLNLHNYDSALFEIVSAKNSKWNANAKENVKTLYSSKITVKPKKQEIDFNMIRKWFEDLTPLAPVKHIHSDTYGLGDNLLVIPVADLHFNMLATAFITGDEYNQTIAEDNFSKIINETITRCSDKNISKILLPLGNDMFNANGIAGTTFKGTPQDEQGHIFDSYIKLYGIITEAINTLKTIAPVDVLFVPSNHDKEISWYFMHTLNVTYKNDTDITVDYSPLPRKYYKFGNTLFVFAHDMKLDRVARTILDDGKEYLKDVDYIEVMLAHLHSENVKQEGNITVRRLPTTSSKSSWANDSNYSSKKVHQSFIFNNKISISDVMYVAM